MKSIFPHVLFQVIQKAFIEVNEDGAESAAATACIVMRRKMVCINQLIINQLIVN